MPETKVRAVETAGGILLAGSTVFAGIRNFEAQEHHNAVGWFTFCFVSLITAVLIPVTVFAFFPWIERLNKGQRPAISEPREQHQLTQEPTKSTEDRIFIDVTPEYLADFYRKLTDLEATTSVKRYLNKWIKISRPLSDISTRDHLGKVVAFVVNLETDPPSGGFRLDAGFQRSEMVPSP
jgi:hypothetical protein